MIEKKPEFDQCYLCSSPSIAPLAGYEKDYLVKCSNCGFVFCKRKPTIEELSTHYAAYPREESISGITMKRYEALLDQFEKYRVTNNLFDVGCGDGFFLIAAKKRGWNVFGTEYTEAAVLKCRQKGIEMTQSPLDPSNYPAGFFDVVTSFEVLEHINNPVEELNAFNAVLRTGGLLYVTTPNFNSLSRFILAGKWNVIEYPEHLAYYTVRTLTAILERARFRKLSITTTGLSIRRFAQSSGVSSSPEDETWRSRTEKGKFLFYIKAIINAGLNFSRKGDAMKGWFIKT